MKALVLTQFGKEPEMSIEERTRPTPRSGFTLVKMHSATVNPLSSQVQAGIVAMAKVPLVLSNDGAGIVEESDRFPTGTRVAIYGGAQLGISEDGLQQQWVLVDDKRIIVLPEELSLDQGAALPINYVTAYQALTRVGEVKRGQMVLISGASGSVGHALIQTANALGARAVAVVSSSDKIAAAIASGAYAAIDLSSQDLNEQVGILSNGKGADLAFDPVGGSMLGDLLSNVCERGAVISIGFVGGAEANVNVADIVIKEKRILGYDAWLEIDSDIAKAISALREFIAAGKISPRIDRIFPMEQHAEAYKYLSSRKATGTILMGLTD